MRIAVTGGTGFIGSNLLPALVAHGHQPVALARRLPEPGRATDGVEWVAGDLSDRAWDPAADLPPAIDAVIHLAQAQSYRNFPDAAPEIFEVNTAATLKLLDYARRAGASHFLYASSGSVYTGMTEPVLSEDLPISPSHFSGHPLGFYCATKLCGEALVESFRTQIPSVTSLRIFAPYGPGGEASLVNRLVGKVARGETVEIQGNPGLTFNPIHVGDVVLTIEHILKSATGPGVLNLAGIETVSLTDLVKIAGKLSGREPDIRYPTSGSTNSPNLVGSIRKMKDIVGDSFTPLSQGISGLCEMAVQA